jgi:phospholipid-translocating ATPase
LNTKQLDGETNLKPKLPFTQIDAALKDISNKQAVDSSLDFVSSLKIYASKPDADLYKFQGSVEMGGSQHSLDLKQFLHRGALVKNSNYLDAVVVYTGVDTKIVMNQGKYIFKQSQLDKAINLITIWNMLVIFILATIMTLKAFSFLDENMPEGGGGAAYIFYGAPSDLGIKAFGSYYLLFNQFIPFELIIILEMVKIHYTGFIEADVHLINEESGRQIKVQNLSMHEEIGQIQYLFCDKTGTLTQNKLLFRELESRKHSVEDQSWLMRCIALCHDAVRINGKLSGPS